MTDQSAKVSTSMPECSLPGPRTRRQKRLAEEGSDCLAVTSKETQRIRRRKTSATAVSLFVRWYNPSGKTKVSHLALKPIETVDALQGISKNLVEKAFPVVERPDYLTGPDFYKFTPAEEFMSLPGDIARTEFRLVITHEGWEYCILERDLGAHLDSQRNMLVTVIEFESTALMIGQLGLRVNLIAYPVVSVKKAFLDDMEHQLKTDPNFKGQLGSSKC